MLVVFGHCSDEQDPADVTRAPTSRPGLLMAARRSHTEAVNTNDAGRGDSKEYIMT
jgi:hypothetical protein